MKTDALIEALSRDAEPVHLARTWRRMALAGWVGALLAGLAVWGVFGLRDNLGEVWGAVLAKTGFCLAAVAAAAPLALALAKPSTRVRALFLPAALFVVASLSVAALALAATSPEARASAWLAEGFPECLRRIPILATPVAVALLFVVRGLTPTRLTLAGAALGALSGAIAAVAYSWFCPVDSLAYVATWYLAAILLCAGLGALFGRWLLRW